MKTKLSNREIYRKALEELKAYPGYASGYTCFAIEKVARREGQKAWPVLQHYGSFYKPATANRSAWLTGNKFERNECSPSFALEIRLKMLSLVANGHYKQARELGRRIAGAWDAGEIPACAVSAKGLYSKSLKQ